MTWMAGSARLCITPAESLWLAGYAVRTAPARGAISDLYARAVALEDLAGRRFVIASVDLIAVTPAITEYVYEELRSRHGLAREQILLTATHTHYGPEFRSDKCVFFHIPDEFAAKLPAVAKHVASSLVQVIDAALQQLEPATLFSRHTSADFAHNRRRHGVKAGHTSPVDVVDHDVPVLDCRDASGNIKAIVFGYACHNTTIRPDDSRYCGDWAGFACEQLEQANAGATALFLPGAGADQDPEPDGSIELSRQHGKELAEAVQRSLDGPRAAVTGSLRFEMEDVPLPLAAIDRRQLQSMLESADPPQQVKARFLLGQLERGEPLMTSYAAPLQVVRFGRELLLVALSGEPVVDWSLELKAELANRDTSETSRHIWVAGYCNDMFGYLPTRRVQTEGGYEGGRANLWSAIPAPFTDDVEDRISAAVHRVVNGILD